MKKILAFGLLLIIILMFSVSCSSGVSQENYDKVNSDLTAAQAQIQTLQAQVQTLQAQVDSKTAELSARDNDLAAAQEKWARAKAEIGVLNAIFVPSITGELYGKTDAEMANLFLEWRDQVNAIGDANLTAKFQAIMDSQGGQQQTLDFFLALLQDISKSLE
jgi:outer membrane murein-binding lipoprotein Lpp